MNAEKFTPSGWIEFRVEIKEKLKTKYLRFTIQDTGIGIPKKKIGQIFNLDPA
jgi:signal transduction histidine kinase